jgi:hypothetical protein
MLLPLKTRSRQAFGFRQMKQQPGIVLYWSGRLGHSINITTAVRLQMLNIHVTMLCQGIPDTVEMITGVLISINSQRHHNDLELGNYPFDKIQLSTFHASIAMVM